MIKPKYPKRADLSQIARSIVEHATGGPLTPLASSPVAVPKGNATKRKNKREKQDLN